MTIVSEKREYLSIGTDFVAAVTLAKSGRVSVWVALQWRQSKTAPGRLSRFLVEAASHDEAIAMAQTAIAQEFPTAEFGSVGTQSRTKANETWPALLG